MALQQESLCIFLEAGQAKNKRKLNTKQDVTVMKILSLILFSLLLVSCGPVIGQKGPKGYMSPMPLLLRGLPEGDDAFSTGYRDGCYNFIGQNGYGLHRIYDAEPDPEFLTDKQYRMGYKYGARYCGVYVNRDIYL